MIPVYDSKSIPLFMARFTHLQSQWIVKMTSIGHRELSNQRWVIHTFNNKYYIVNIMYSIDSYQSSKLMSLVSSHCMFFCFIVLPCLLWLQHYQHGFSCCIVQFFNCWSLFLCWWARGQIFLVLLDTDGDFISQDFWVAFSYYLFIYQ